MTEKEKMLSGNLYFYDDKDLVEERKITKLLVFELNNLNILEKEKRLEIFKKLLGKIGENCYIKSPFYCDYGANIEIGKNFYANYNTTILDCAKVQIGDNIFFGPNVSLFTVGHPIDAEIRNSGVEFALPISIGNNVWIGGNTVINPNVCIGDNTVIGAGSVVTKDIPSGVVAFGNPCKVHREINENDKKFYFKDLAYKQTKSG